MDQIFSLPVVAFVLAVVLLLRLPIPLSARRGVLLLANAAFLYLFHPLAPVLFLTTSLLGYGLAVLGARGAPGFLMWLVGAPMLVPLFLPKLGALGGFLSSGDQVGNAVGSRAAIFIGASYFTLRALSFAIDARRARKVSLGAFDFLVYNSFFPTIVAGPIERHDHFARTYGRLGRPTGDDIAVGFTRIFHGLVKKVVLGSIAASWAAPVMGFTPGDGLGSGMAWLALYAWVLNTYFDFAGYSDIAIGIARLMGIKLAENFDNPFLRPSIAEFWRGWHLSLSFWIRDYLFLPICGRSRSALRPHVAALVSMGLCGLWHAPNPGWLLWGLMHGAGLSVHQAWTLALRRRFQLKKRLQASLPFRVVSIFLTFNFVALSWTLVIDPYDLRTTLSFWEVLLGLSGGGAP